MAKLTPVQAAEKLIRNLSAATESIKIGVQNVSESPMEKAALAADAYVAGCQQSVTSGKYQAGLRRVSLEEWKAATINKGIPRIASGITAAKSKIISFYNEFFPFLDRVTAEVNAMPKITLEDSIARMTAQVRGVAGFSRSA